MQVPATVCLSTCPGLLGGQVLCPGCCPCCHLCKLCLQALLCHLLRSHMAAPILLSPSPSVRRVLGLGSSEGKGLRAGGSPLPQPCISPAKSSLCGWLGPVGAEARRALMCHFARRHGSWAQRAGTAGARAGRQLQRNCGSGRSRLLPCLCLVRPGQVPALGPCWDLFPKRLMESGGASGATAPGSGHVLHKRAGVAPGMGRAQGAQGDPGGGTRGCTTTKPLAPASLEPSKKLV